MRPRRAIPEEAVLLIADATIMQAETSNSARRFGKTRDGVAVSVYTLTNKNGLTAPITNYGGIVVSQMAPDRNGKLADAPFRSAKPA